MTHGLEPPSSRATRPAPPDGPDLSEALQALRGRLVRYAVKLVWNREDAEELVQDAFKIAATKRLGPGDGHFTPWMFRTTSQLCLNHRRRRRPEPLADWIDIADAQTPDDSTERIERLERLRERIAGLPPQQRVALTLRWIEGLEYDEVARIMELSASAVRAHVHQARRKLVEVMGDDDV